jgi:hypothetical protein
MLLAQVIFYGAGLAGLRQLDRTGRCPKIIYLPAYFIFIHVAELSGFKRWIARRETGVWARAQRAGITKPELGISADSGGNQLTPAKKLV